MNLITAIKKFFGFTTKEEKESKKELKKLIKEKSATNLPELPNEDIFKGFSKRQTEFVKEIIKEDTVRTTNVHINGNNVVNINGRILGVKDTRGVFSKTQLQIVNGTITLIVVVKPEKLSEFNNYVREEIEREFSSKFFNVSGTTFKIYKK
jgi:hypothetical protein